MFKRLYKRFLKWALAPVLSDIQQQLSDVSMSAAVNSGSVHMQLSALAEQVEAIKDDAARGRP